MASWFERRESEDPWGGRQPRYERLASDGPYHVQFADNWLPPHTGSGRPRWRRVLARFHNPGGGPLAPSAAAGT